VTITLRVDALWEFNKTITHMVVGAFAITYSIAVAFFIVALIDLRSAYAPSSPYAYPRG
jgi:hypothetical protein